jgi:hypothetical protein
MYLHTRTQRYLLPHFQDTEFKEVLGCTKAEWKKYKKWKQVSLPSSVHPSLLSNAICRLLALSALMCSVVCLTRRLTTVCKIERKK